MHLLGMPLNREQPGNIRAPFHCLDQTVVGPAAGNQAGCQVLDGLMMKRVGKQPLDAQRASGATPRLKPDVMGSCIPGRLRIVVDRSRALGREILRYNVPPSATLMT